MSMSPPRRAAALARHEASLRLHTDCCASSKATPRGGSNNTLRMLSSLNQRVKSALSVKEIEVANREAPAWVSDAISVSVVDKRRKGNDRLSMAALGSNNLTQEIKSKQEEITGEAAV